MGNLRWSLVMSVKKDFFPLRFGVNAFSNFKAAHRETPGINGGGAATNKEIVRELNKEIANTTGTVRLLTIPANTVEVDPGRYRITIYAPVTHCERTVTYLREVGSKKVILQGMNGNAHAYGHAVYGMIITNSTCEYSFRTKTQLELVTFTSGGKGQNNELGIAAGTGVAFEEYCSVLIWPIGNLLPIDEEAESVKAHRMHVTVDPGNFWQDSSNGNALTFKELDGTNRAITLI